MGGGKEARKDAGRRETCVFRRLKNSSSQHQMKDHTFDHSITFDKEKELEEEK